MKKILFILMMFFTFILSVHADDSIAQGKIYPSELGIVQNVNYIDLDDNPEVAQVKQIAEIKIIRGADRGEIVVLDNVLTGNPYYDIKLKKGIKVILHVEDSGDGIEYSVEDVHRSGVLLWLSLIFCGLLIYVGRKKGFYSLISIAVTCILIYNFLCPLVLLGVNPVLGTILISILSTALTMYLVGGFNKKSTSAVLGCVLSLVFAGILSFVTVKAAYLNGFSSENTMFLFSAHPELDFISIVISTMMLATLGAVMDVAMSIASTINEIFLIDSTKSVKELFISGMNVGRDIIGTMANTLILVYLGGSLPLLLLASNIDLQKFINLNQVVTEIASALIGSCAIVICVPITAIVAANLVRKITVKPEAVLESNFSNIDEN